jgi:H+-transporting ATPase
LVIAVDNTEISERPDKWRIGQLLTMSAVLALMLTVLSFAHFYIARDYFKVTPNELHSIMYLHISSGKSIFRFDMY